jgi:hypothetical protein
LGDDSFVLDAELQDLMAYIVRGSSEPSALRILKHLPGRHPQQRHAGARGVAVTTEGEVVTRDWLLNNLSWEMPDGGRDNIIAVLEEGGVTEGELRELDGFSDENPPTHLGYKVGKDGFYAHSGGFEAAALYVNEWPERKIYVAPAILAEQVGKEGPHGLAKLVVHELGHHVTSTHPNREVLRKRAESVIWKERSDWDFSYAGTGLRHYSVTTPEELLADTYMTMKFGSDEQKAKLERFWQEGTGEEVPPVAEMFKQLSGSVSVLELRSIDTGDGVVGTSLVPVEVTYADLLTTPWYYLEDTSTSE